jgi:cytochrome c553
MAGERDPSAAGSPWPRIGWSALAGMVAVSGVLGFLVLARYQQNGPALGVWGAICRAVGLTSDEAPSNETKPPLRVPSQIAWTRQTLDRIAAGDARRGATIATNCEACHGENGVSTAGLVPTLAGMNAAVIYKQLDDFRTDARNWNDMHLMASLLSRQDSADVAAYWASRPGLAQFGPAVDLQPGHTLRQTDAVARLVYAGDPERGIAPCAACHGPAGHKLGAPTLQGQQAAYIAHQLTAFATGFRQNDINEQMRVVAKRLTPQERNSLAAFFGAGALSPQTKSAQAAVN